jgi:hypothetical protein
MMKNMRERFAVPKPDDQFVVDMLRYVAEKYDAPQCASLKTKVIHCTGEAWTGLWPLARDSTDRGTLAREYTETPKVNPNIWREVNVFLFQCLRRDARTGQIVSVSKDKRREIMFSYGMTDEAADAFSQFDAIVFVHKHNIIRANQAGMVFPLHGPLTHETIHVIETRTGQHIISGFNPKQYHDPVSLAVLQGFIEKTGRNEFKHRYFPEPKTN